jgi:hypothetical protein
MQLIKIEGKSSLLVFWINNQENKKGLSKLERSMLAFVPIYNPSWKPPGFT